MADKCSFEDCKWFEMVTGQDIEGLSIHCLQCVNLIRNLFNYEAK